MLLTVAMMRPGDKLRSYRFLAEALAWLTHLDWRLRVVGDGDAQAEVVAAFATLPPERIVWCGRLEGSALADALSRADIFAWPGFGEAFGLAYLEAQLAGLPVVALDTAGVGSVVRHGETGLLIGGADPADYAAALATLLRDESLRLAMGTAATAWVRRERTLATASQRLDAVLGRLWLSNTGAAARHDVRGPKRDHHGLA